MVALYFGLPGCGKTTFLAKFAKKHSDNITMGISPYTCVYSNVPLKNIPNFRQIQFDYLGQYDIYRGLVLIDEATLECDSRDYKSLKDYTKEFMLLHRHCKCDVIFFTQQWDGIDKKIRVITDRVFYMYKAPIIGRWFTSYYRVPYRIIIPSGKKDDSEKLGEIIQGYCKPSFFVRLFTPPIYRKPYYKHFDSWHRPKLPPLPDDGLVGSPSWDGKSYGYTSYGSTKKKSNKSNKFNFNMS